MNSSALINVINPGGGAEFLVRGQAFQTGRTLLFSWMMISRPCETEIAFPYGIYSIKIYFFYEIM